MRVKININRENLPSTGEFCEVLETELLTTFTSVSEMLELCKTIVDSVVHSWTSKLVGSGEHSWISQLSEQGCGSSARIQIK